MSWLQPGLASEYEVRTGEGRIIANSGASGTFMCDCHENKLVLTERHPKPKHAPRTSKVRDLLRAARR